MVRVLENWWAYTWGAYIRGGIYSEVYGILRFFNKYRKITNMSNFKNPDRHYKEEHPIEYKTIKNRLFTNEMKSQIIFQNANNF